MSPHAITSRCTSPTAARSADHDDPGDNRDSQTCELLRRAESCRGERRLFLRESAIRLNVSLADSLARRYHDRGEELDDLVQVARLALVKAVDRFDPDRGDFSVYAVPTIAGELKRHFRDHGWTVRPPRRIQELQAGLSTAWAELAQQLGRAPGPADLAEHLDRTVEEVRDAMAAKGCFRTDSLDVPVGEGPSLLDRLGRPDPNLEHAETLAILTPACHRLSRADQQLLHLRFVEQLSQSEIAARLGTNQMAISRRLRRVLARLRDLLSDTCEGMTAAEERIAA